MLTRWDPFRELMNLRTMMDRMLETSFDDQYRSGQTTSWGLPLDVSENDDEFFVKASLPGIKPEDLDITITGSTLTIKGELKEETETKETQYHLRERRFGSFSRSITLPSNVKTEDIQANYENGELTLHLPKAEEAKPKRISVESRGSEKVLEGSFKGSGNGHSK